MLQLAECYHLKANWHCLGSVMPNHHVQPQYSFLLAWILYLPSLVPTSISALRFYVYVTECMAHCLEHTQALAKLRDT